jgi:uncharacterized membrane protein
MAVGYALGTVYDMASADRRRVLSVLGVAALVTFVLLRATNFYGDPKPWSVQPDVARTMMSFVNVTKYPPSLLYLLATLGPAFLLLAVFESARGRVAQVLATFGSVPLFFYVLHIALAHVAAEIVGSAAGFDLPVVYLAWVLVVAMLYPACRWFAALKRRRTDWWLSYL